MAVIPESEPELREDFNDFFDTALCGFLIASPEGRILRINARLAGQPYKAMIYPNRDKSSGRIVPNSYLIGWEYSTNDDFQDVVCRVDNVSLVPAP